jgi:hypothetical protein
MIAARVLALVVAAGCSRSVLIPRSDATYRHALERYRHTRELVAQSAAPDDDQAMFMQAEALYRYRFAAPPRSSGSYLAQVGAAVIDLPALQSLAGSLDLYALRLKSYDGAVQVWETLLAMSPQTPLRPLALYRLGWAYRNAMASGFPSSSEHAFDELVASYPASPLAPVAREARDTDWKSPGTATALSIVPGLGQIYAREYGNGTIRLGVALAATAAVVVPAVVAYERRSDLSWSRDWPLLVTGLAGVIVLTIDYSSSYDDALRAVMELNERREDEFEARHPGAP